MKFISLQQSSQPVISSNLTRIDIDRLAQYVNSQCPNRNSREAYAKSVIKFLHWREAMQLGPIGTTQPSEVARWVQFLATRYAVATVRLRLAAVRGFLDWMVLNHFISHNPARSVRGPKETLAKGKTPALSAREARLILEKIPQDTLIGLRDKAIIASMLYTFARVGAVLALRREDIFLQDRRTWIRLHEKGGKVADLPCHHELDEILNQYLDIHAFQPREYIFQSIGQKADELSGRRLLPANFYLRVKKYARVFGLSNKLTNHSFRATGITAFLNNNGSLEMAAQIANHSSTKTTQLYDRRSDAIAIGEVERIRFE